jgi:hypothetical protein
MASREPRDAVGRAQIGGDRMRAGPAVCRDLVGERVKLHLAPRGQHQRMTFLRKHARKRRADPGRRSGNQTDRLHE